MKNHLTTDVNGKAEITLADGQSIKLYGVAAASLSAWNFVFNQTPVTNNAGTMTIGDGALLPLSGTIKISGGRPTRSRTASKPNHGSPPAA